MTEKIRAAKEILDSSVMEFCADHGYFAYPVSLLSPSVSDKTQSVATDGNGVYFDAIFLLKWVADGKSLSVPIVHTLLHNLLLHPFKKERGEDYDLACDISVGFIADGMNIRYGSDKDAANRKSTYKAIIDKYNAFNARAAQLWLNGLEVKEKQALAPLFVVCDHSSWQGGNGGNKNSDGGGFDPEAKWTEIAKGLITAESPAGERFTSLVRAAVGGKYDYRYFLRRFLNSNERIRTNDEEFDYIYYCLGLSLYKNVPLVENLEYRDERDVSDVVVAIDTSGSTKGEPVVRFLKETYSLVSQSFSGEKYRLRILQCDCAVTDDVTINGREEFDKLMSAFTIKGGGGTDFRPVFDLVAKDKKYGRKVKGIIYFTDGFGVFPDGDPGIKTCFVLYGNSAATVRTPHYAYRIELGGEALL